MRVFVENGVLHVQLGLRERIWACRGGVCAPLSSVVRMDRGIPGPRLLDIRAPGTFIPGIIKAGTYLTRDGKEFWYVPRGMPHYVTIELREGPYRRIVLGLDDAESVERALGVTEAARTPVGASA